jgi:hypothetical protein
MTELKKISDTDKLIDKLEATLVNFPTIELELIHRFTPGMYIREIFIPAGTMLTSMKHKTEHPFILSKGEIHVTSDNENTTIYKAPYCGITKPNTRRALFAKTDVVWTTFHATDETDVEKIGESILEPHENSLLTGDRKLKPQWKNSLTNK